MKDFLAFFVLPLCTALFGLYLGVSVGAEDKMMVSDARMKCNQFLVETNAPRNDKCEIVVSYKIIKGEQK